MLQQGFEASAIRVQGQNQPVPRISPRRSEEVGNVAVYIVDVPVVCHAVETLPEGPNAPLLAFDPNFERIDIAYPSGFLEGSVSPKQLSIISRPIAWEDGGEVS